MGGARALCRDPSAHAPAPPKFSSEWQLGPPDLVLHVAQPYQLYADGPEVFWNFVIPVPITAQKWVTGDGGAAGQRADLSSCECDYRPLRSQPAGMRISRGPVFPEWT